MSHKYVYLFSEGDETMRELLGGKGANLSQMVKLGMPVPDGFIVSTEACARFYEDDRTIGKDIEEQIYKALTEVEKNAGKKFGDSVDPLLVSVRSGARASMPGMMDTILNLGLNDTVAKGMTTANTDPLFKRFVYDSYRRFIQMFADVVMEIPKQDFDVIVDGIKEDKGYSSDDDLTADDMVTLVTSFKELYKEKQGEEFPEDPKVQMMESIKAVFRSWDNPRANFYRRMNNIPYEWGTAVNIQMMVFGNLNENSGTGVAFTRDPATGEDVLFGEYLINAQGEDVVAGIRTPEPLAKLEDEMPEIYKEFADYAKKLEKHYKDMQDMEFTIENGKLYLLQTRSGKRTATSALKIAVDFVNEKMLTEEEAVLSVDPQQLDALLHPQFDEKALKAAKSAGRGLAASPGAANGLVAFTAEDAKVMHDKGEKVILVRLETSPEDIEGMSIASGILTARGGMTSHAAVVARGMGTCCVSGLDEVVISEEKKEFTLDGKTIKEGEVISLNGTTGDVYLEEIDTVQAEITGDFNTFMDWADNHRNLSIRTNADSPEDAKTAIDFGAEGIGLCRTEHMFFESDRIKSMREMILAKDAESRKAALAKLLPIQKADFVALYETMEDRPVTIRFLDPPLHEFLPTKKEDIEEIAKELKVSVDEINEAITALHEFNPMMGHRGCRLSISFPEIAVMQTEAVISAAIDVNKKNPEYNVCPEIMIPLVGDVKELQFVKKYVTETADRVIKENGVELEYEVGTMIEIPRATVTADKIAKEAEFFSFGTNDLTQMTFGFSRDDASKFLDDYYDNNIYGSDPFERLDQEGVGVLVEMAVERGKKGNPDITLGICGEHGGDPSTIEFCHNVGLDYVSCSPFRVPIAKLAAAQAALKNPRK